MPAVAPIEQPVNRKDARDNEGDRHKRPNQSKHPEG
jgi:hypothetical protein